MDDGRAALLRVAFRHALSEPNVEAGYERVRALGGAAFGYAAFCDTLAACVRDRLVRDPVRLTDGALQCHWRLELTPAGVDAVRAADQPR